MTINITHLMDKSTLLINETDSSEGLYEICILDENRITGLLQLMIKRQESVEVKEYDISGLISFTEYSLKHKIDREVVKDLFISIENVKNSMNDFLLSQDGLMLSPEYIFYSLKEKQYRFCYVPGEKLFSKSINSLAEFLISKIDYSDKNVTESIYNFYENVINGRYEINRLIEELSKISSVYNSEGEGNSNANLVEEKFEYKLDSCDDEVSTSDMVLKCVGGFVLIITLVVVGYIFAERYSSMIRNNIRVVSVIAISMSVIVFVFIYLFSQRREKIRRKKRILMMKELVEKE